LLCLLRLPVCWPFLRWPITPSRRSSTVKKSVKLEGTITKVEWTNPHIWMYLDVKDDSGNVVKWQCEGGAPNTLTRAGWSKDSLKPGDQVSLDGWLAKDGSKTCNTRSVKMPDGKSVFAGSSNNDYK